MLQKYLFSVKISEGYYLLVFILFDFVDFVTKCLFGGGGSFLCQFHFLGGKGQFYCK